MRLRSGTLSSSLGRSTALQGSLLVLLALLAGALSLAVPSQAQASGEVLPIGQPLPVAAPLVETAPTVSSIEPTSGSTAGGTAVKIKGTGFLAGSTVTIGSAATSPEVISETEMKATTAPHAAGAVEVVVTDSAGSSTGGPSYTYIAPPPTVEPTTPESTPPSPAPQSPPPSSPGPSPKGPTPPPTGPPAPVLARSLDLERVTGQVSIRLPGARRFVSLSAARQVPIRTVVETAHGEVSVTAATARHRTQTGEFFDGEFVLTQARNGRVLATLTGGNFAVCPRTPSSRRASGGHLVRRLWAEVRGSFATAGKYATGIVNGAQWLTEDLCEGTLILPTRNRVEVTDLVRHLHIEALPGDVYIAKAR